MLRFILRVFGLLFLAGGFIYLVYDGTKSIADSAVSFTALGEAWASLNPGSYQALQPAIENNIAAWLWDPIMTTVLQQPAWLVLGIIGAVLILLGRKRRPLIGYAR